MPTKEINEIFKNLKSYLPETNEDDLVPNVDSNRKVFILSHIMPGGIPITDCVARNVFVAKTFGKNKFNLDDNWRQINISPEMYVYIGQTPIINNTFVQLFQIVEWEVLS